MERTQKFNLLTGGLLLLFAGGCASPIAKSYRQGATPGVTFSMVFQNPDTFQGNTVIWGGSIIRTVTTKDGSHIYILQSSLDSRDKPEAADTSEGRFIATTDRRLDPMVYTMGRKVTVAGKVTGKKIVVYKKSGDTYIYPVVQSEQIYLWPAPEPEAPAYWAPYYGPYWDYPYFEGGFEGDEDWEGGDDDY